MRILVACEYSGIVRDAFAARGHEAWSCDILPTEAPGNHIQGDVLKIIKQGWDLMIAHPPCTYLTYAGNSSWNRPGRLQKRLKALQFFAKLWEAPIKRICIENPLGIASSVITKHSQIIQPYFWGDEDSKRTCLWLKNLPKLYHVEQTTIFEEGTQVKPKVYGYYKKGKHKGEPIYFHGNLPFTENRGHLRSRSFEGIANAMAEQWGNL